MYSFCCAEIRLAPYCLESLNIVWYKAKVKRAQRHMKIKEMAKKTSLATTSEEDGDNGMVECCIRVITTIYLILYLLYCRLFPCHTRHFDGQISRNGVNSYLA